MLKGQGQLGLQGKFQLIQGNVRLFQHSRLKQKKNKENKKAGEWLHYLYD